MADETKELVKKSFGLKSNATAISNSTSSFLSVKAPSLPQELKFDVPKPVALPQELKLDAPKQ